MEKHWMLGENISEIPDIQLKHTTKPNWIQKYCIDWLFVDLGSFGLNEFYIDFIIWPGNNNHSSTKD